MQTDKETESDRNAEGTNEWLQICQVFVFIHLVKLDLLTFSLKPATVIPFRLFTDANIVHDKLWHGPAWLVRGRQMQLLLPWSESLAFEAVISNEREHKHMLLCTLEPAGLKNSGQQPHLHGI